MKKSFYYLTCAILLTQAAQAGKYFDVSPDVDGNKELYFKKSADKFNKALELLPIVVKTSNVTKIVFAEGITQEQKARAFRELLDKSGLQETRNGFLANAKNVQVLNSCLTSRPNSPKQTLNLRHVDTEIYEECLPILHTMLDMTNIDSLVVESNRMTEKGLHSLNTALSKNNGIVSVRFNGYPIAPINTQTIINELLTVPEKRSYSFNVGALKGLSPEILESALTNYSSAEVWHGKKVFPDKDSYQNYVDADMKSYGNVCTSRFSPIFKASFPVYIHEDDQKELLRTLSTASLDEQRKTIGKILEKEDTRYKGIIIYKATFEKIEKTIQQQAALQQTSQDYQNLETQKNQLIQDVLKRMG